MTLRTTLALLLFAPVAFVGCNNAGSNGAEKTDSSAVDSLAKQAATEGEAGAKPVLKFENETHDFGKIKEGEKVTHTFNFTNAGNAPLVLNKEPKPACGCTTADYTKDPVPPGQKGYVKVEFDSKGRTGVNNKDVVVFSNAGDPVKLKFKVEVEAAK